MADRGRLPAYFARVSARTQTPYVATVFVTLCILGLSLFLPIDRLAGWTSQIVLCVFICVNLALIAIKHRIKSTINHFSIPLLVPVFGMISSITLLAASLF
jgi:amino acid transporter